MNLGQFFLYLLAIWIWVGIISIWIFAMVDLFRRRDLHGWMKAVWLLAIIVLPVIGTAIYLITMPRHRYQTSDRAEAMMAERADTQPWRYGPTTSSAEQLRQLADLADQGRISPDEFEAAKSQVLGQRSAATL